MRARRRSIASRLAKHSGYIFLFLTAAIFFLVGFNRGHREYLLVVVPEEASPPPETRRSVVDEHPIERLMEDAEAAYRAKLSRQSKTLEAAVQQYKKRYQQDPPHGFDEWWAFAKKNNVKMVDEYDGLMDDLRPFWEISGEELRRRAGQVCRFEKMTPF